MLMLAEVVTIVLDPYPGHFASFGFSDPLSSFDSRDSTPLLVPYKFQCPHWFYLS
jgi:hypothetical protein